MAKHIAVILSGCGVYDGSEIYETTLTLLNLEKAGATYQCLAPDVPQGQVIDHHTGQEAAGEQRSVLTEAARLARGEIKNIADATPTDFDAIIFPGGFGAAKNLSNFAFEENLENLKVEEYVERFVQQGFKASVPFGFICITPACVAAIALRDKGLTLTIGNDEGTAARIEALGHTHQAVPVRQMVRDPNHLVASTPAYMTGKSLEEVEEGISKLVREVLQMILEKQNAKSA